MIWRLHRGQAYVAGAALAALTGLLLLTGIAMARDYHAFLASCGTTRSCGGPTQLLFHGDGAITTLVDATMAVPLLLGVFWGAPLLAREFEAGTHNLAWTQGVTRRGWLSRNIDRAFDGQPGTSRLGSCHRSDLRRPGGQGRAFQESRPKCAG